MANDLFDRSDADENGAAESDYLDKTEENPDAVAAPEDTPEENEKKPEMPFSGERYTFSDLTGKNRPGNTAFSLVSVILAGISVLLGFLQLTIGALIFAVVAVGSALFSRKRLGYFDTLAIVGLFLAIFGAIVAVFYFVLSLFLPSPAPDPEDLPSSDPGSAIFGAIVSFLRRV